MLTKNVRRDIKKEGLKNLKRRYYLNIIIIFIVSVIINGGYQFASRRTKDINDTTVETAASVLEDAQQNVLLGKDSKTTNAGIIWRFLVNVFEIDDIPLSGANKATSTKYYGGVASVFVNEITGSQSYIFGIINGINEVLFKGRIAGSIVIFIFAILSILLFVFVKNVIVVGKNRYFLEQRRYHETGPGELLFPYKNKRLKNIAHVMFLKYVFRLLWNLTVVGGFIKRYEYLLIPYIVAENPDIDAKSAFAISKKLMYGDKWKAFVVDLSLLPWYLLSYATFNLTGLFFSDAYIECIRAEMYMRIRADKKDSLEVNLRKWLNDDMLDIDHVEEGEHPSGKEVLDIPTIDIHTLKYNYMRKYSILSLMQLFFTYAFVGWAWEVVLYVAATGHFINRGTMHGPWLPIYGCGGLLIILLLKPLREKPPLLFAGTVVVCGTVEYVSSWLLELLFNAKWWDYTGYFLNLNGRICFEGLVVFGMAGFAFTYVLSPMIDDIYKKIDVNKRRIICSIITVIFLIDAIWSAISPNVGAGITDSLI